MKSIKKSFLTKTITVLLSTFFVFSTITITSCGSTKIESTVQGTKLKSNDKIITGVLENGMNYYVLENKIPANRIFMRLVVKVGSNIEEENEQGVAHFIEHLCFNGTENFEKNDIVHYFEKIGMNFGSDVNAYTSFEQTVYMLECPADDPEMFKTSMQILCDWAHAVTFDSEELEKERGVVIEEWRTREQGIQGRLSNFQVNSILKDSRHSERLPIGKPEIIKNITREEVIDFYKKWYRPEIMSVVVVGDKSVSELEKVVKETMGKIPASEKPISVPKFNVPVQTEKSIARFSDKEQKYPLVYFFQQKTENLSCSTEEVLKENLTCGIANLIVNARLSEISLKPEAPWLEAVMFQQSFSNEGVFNCIGFVPKANMYDVAIKTLFDEYDRFLTFGVTESELERTKQAYFASIEQNYKNKDKTLSNDYVNSIVGQILNDNTSLSPEDAYKLQTKLLAEITLDDIKTVSNKYFSDRGTICNIILPEGEKSVPSDKEIMNIWTSYKNTEISAYQESVSEKPLLEKPAKKAKIKSTKKVKELDATEYVLENGIRIITKKTDFKKNLVQMSANSKGGTFYIEENDFPSAVYATSYATLSGYGDVSFTDLQKKLTGKTVNFNSAINNTTEGIYGSSSNEDFEILLQLTNLAFTQPRFTDEGWNYVMANASQMAQNYGSQPGDIFNAKIRELLYNNSIRASALTPEFVSKMNKETSERIYKERFANPADFTFTFVGDFNEKQLLDLCCYYLGNLPTTNKKEETKYVYIPFPKGKPAETVHKGQDNLGSVFMSFGGALPAAKDMESGFKEAQLFYQLADILDIRLRENIREDKSGTYGVGVDSKLEGYPERYYYLNIYFDCEPERQDELKQAVLDTINDLKNNKISEDEVTKLKESYVRNKETNLFENDWWIYRLEAALVFTYEPLTIAKDSTTVPSWITAEEIQNQANKYLNTDNFVTVFLKPDLK